MLTPKRVPPAPALVVFLLVVTTFIAPPPIVNAATPSSGNMSPTATTLTWGGGPFTGSSTNPIAADCTNSTCDNFLITVTGTDPTIHKLTVTASWTNPLNDFDLHAFNNATNQEIAVDGRPVGNQEQVTFAAGPGVYRISMLVYRVASDSYTAVAVLGTVPPEPPNQFRTGIYQRFDFGFKPEVKLPEQERSLIFIDQDVEPEIEVDRFGTIYIGAIRGVPGGVDFWRSDDGGASFAYLGQPDGAQSPSPVPPSPEGGLGGGDDDISLGDPFYVVPPVPGVSPGIQSRGHVSCTSLWLGSATMSVSSDRGDNWVPFPFTTAELDRQWNVARGQNTVYMSLRKLAEAENHQHDVFVTQSDDGGATWAKGSFVQDPATGVPDALGGNCVLQSDGTLLGTFVSADQHDLYIWRTPRYPAHGPANLPVGTLDAPVFTPNTFDTGLIFHGAGGLTVRNVFPIMTRDQGDNLHIVFSDRRNIYLMSCPAGADPSQAASWTKPLPLNAPRVAGFEFTHTCVLPWVRAGASGKLAVMWYATSVDGDPDTPDFQTNQVPWQIVYAQVENALAATPNVYLDIASKQGGGVIHKGQICLRGLGCPSGTRQLAEYSSLTVDNDGFPNIIYAGTIINGVDPPGTGAICFFTKAVNRPLSSGTGPVTEMDCGKHDMTQAGGWHDVNDSRASDGHYCRNVGANKGTKAYLEFHYTGDRVDLVVVRGPRGGDAEVLIDGVSQGKVDFYRPPSDPTHPDNSGKTDLTFGDFASFPTASGTHTFRLNVLNDTGITGRDMVYVDGFLIHGGIAPGGGNPSENTIVFTGTAPSGVAGTPGVVMNNVVTTPTTRLIEGVLETPQELLSGRELKIFAPSGGLLGDAANLLPTASLQTPTAVAGAYNVAVVNTSGSAMPYTLRVITTQSSTGPLAGAAPQAVSAARIADPIDGTAVVRYALERGGHVAVRIYDVAGRLVRSFEEDQPAGIYGIKWDGRRPDGTRVPSGIYFYRVNLPNGRSEVRRTAILR